MPQAIQEQINLSMGQAINLSASIEAPKNNLCADTILSGDTRAANGIIGTGAVIVGINLDRPFVSGSKMNTLVLG